jgi:hypothetical protein
MYLIKHQCTANSLKSEAIATMQTLFYRVQIPTLLNVSSYISHTPYGTGLVRASAS